MQNGRSANEVWLDLIREIAEQGQATVPRGKRCLEILNKSTVVDMTRPVVTVEARNLGRRFLCAEAWWILSGRNDVAGIEPYSRQISQFSDDGIRFSGAYGPKIVDQIRYVVDALVRDLNTRQAVLNIWRENPRDTKDYPCTLSAQWMVRDGKLHCFDTMRSSDAWLGWPYDCFNFSMLSALILLEMWARDDQRLTHQVKLGSLHLTAASQHLYETDINSVLSVLTDAAAEEYEPLRVQDFRDNDALIKHLSALKDKQWELLKSPWMATLLHPEKPKDFFSREGKLFAGSLP